MPITLSQRQRLGAAGIYLLALWLIAVWARSHVPNSHEHVVFWFYSGVLMIVLGKYVVEPYFTTPADAIVNGLALLISLQALKPVDQTQLLGSAWLWWYSLGVIVVATVAIVLKDAAGSMTRRVAQLAYALAELLGKSQRMFSAVYLLSAYSFFGRSNDLAVFVTTVGLWICLVFFDLAGIAIDGVTRLIGFARRRPGDELGAAIGCENPLLYKVEIDRTRFKGNGPGYGDLVAIETSANTGSIGMVVDRKQLLSKSWLSVYILTDDLGEVLHLDLRAKKLVADPHSVFASANKVFAVNLGLDLAMPDRMKIEHNPLFAYKQSFVGYITRDSNINTVSFMILRDRDATNREVAEGTILKTTIYGQTTLYQVINGDTREEHLEGFDSHGYTVGIARKLGRYNLAEHELETRKWMPTIYTPFFFGYEGTVTSARIGAIARDAIGRLPETDLEVRLKDINAIVTHNTAILGILGIGKSCLSFEVVKKVVATGVKVICVDITNQYNTPGGLQGYVGAAAISLDLSETVRTTLKSSKDDPKKLFEGNPQKSGNAAEYRAALRVDLAQFLGSNALVKIYNPDIHPVSKGVSFKSTSFEDLTIPEKTRLIAEQLFLQAREAGESETARFLLVLEEAHSLVPERSSIANAGDDHAANGTAKVILQGRKYGLGSLIITQRTANVSKSILNQCNTIFAMRVFDDTGKTFLENYIGKDYADTLPTLEERHAIAIGRGLRLKQPVIVQLNDRAHCRVVPAAVVQAAPVVSGPPTVLPPNAASSQS